MATGQSGFDPDDFFDSRRYDYQRKQDISDRYRQDRSRDEDARRRALEEQRIAVLDAMQTIVNDDGIVLSPEEVKIINDKQTRMMPNGEIVTRIKNGRRQIRTSNQFRRDLIIPDFQKKKRKKTKTDKNMSKALKLANQKFRTAKGQLRKGATQAQLMKYAHKLLRKMK